MVDQLFQIEDGVLVGLVDVDGDQAVFLVLVVLLFGVVKADVQFLKGI